MGSVVGYSLVIPESFVNWKGMHVMGGNGHQGYIKPLTGTLAFDANGTIAGGYFELDMNTITITDKKDTSSDNGLVSHLKDPDFFDVKKYPKGTFQLTKAIKASRRFFLLYYRATDLAGHYTGDPFSGHDCQE